jgi:hypothetical protein
VYSRDYADRTLHFEASGGLVNSSLVMRDRETDSYWSIMKGRSTAGELRGTKLQELPGGRKTRWRNWLRNRPDTKVLSVQGREHADDSYEDYWRDRRGFRGQRARDHRLETKEPIFAFERSGHTYAIAHSRLSDGRTLKLEGDSHLLLYRRPDAPLFESTDAFVSRAGFARDDGHWVELETGARFDPARSRFRGGKVERQRGFDTFWYNWSLNNADTKLLE